MIRWEVDEGFYKEGIRLLVFNLLINFRIIKSDIFKIGYDVRYY